MKKLLKDNQSGSILLLALLILSGSVLTGLTIGTIVLNEVRQSRNLDQAIVAFHQASSGAEQAIYYFRKDNGNFDGVVGTASGACNFQAANLLGDCDYYYELAQNQTIALEKGEVSQINMFNANLGAGFGVDYLEVDWYDQNPGNEQEPWLEVILTEIPNDWDGAPLRETINLVKLCNDDSGGTYPAGDTLGNAISYCGQWVENANIDTTKNYKVRFRSLYDDVRMVITARDNGDAIVETGQTHIFVNGAYRDSNQAVKVEISDVEASKDFSDFVLFTDCDLVKGAGSDSTCP